MRRVAEEDLGIQLPEKKRYAVGQIFMGQEDEDQDSHVSTGAGF